MMSTGKKDFNVFYSWQSDSPKKTNQYAIRNALKAAVKEVNLKHPELNVIADEATLRTSGSPNIIAKIMEKIELADVFVADVTTITARRAKKHCPNPNVTYELGYAVGQCGWDRIVLLFNEVHGKFPTDLPFDFAQHRAKPYNITETSPKMEHEKLSKYLEMAIIAVIEKNPKKAIDFRGKSRSQIEHERDVEAIEWMMSKINLHILQNHIQELPRVIDDHIFWFWEGFKGVVTSTQFHLYDQALHKIVEKLFNAWAMTLAYDRQYRSNPNGTRYIFSNPGDAPLNKSQQKDWDAIEKAQLELKNALDELLDRVHSSYLEINPMTTSGKAWNEYKKFQDEIKSS